MGTTRSRFWGGSIKNSPLSSIPPKNNTENHGEKTEVSKNHGAQIKKMTSPFKGWLLSPPLMCLGDHCRWYFHPFRSIQSFQCVERLRRFATCQHSDRRFRWYGEVVVKRVTMITTKNSEQQNMLMMITLAHYQVSDDAYNSLFESKSQLQQDPATPAARELLANWRISW